MARKKQLKRLVLIPNFNKVSAESLAGETETGNLDMSDLNLEGVHAVQIDEVAGTVEVEYIKPANEKMTIKEFHDYFSKATGSGRKHVDEARKVGLSAHAEKDA
jgi:hypothetical protein